MRSVPWWALLSAAMAPLFLIGGWTLAAALQPAGYNSVRDTISALAGVGAADRWVMTIGLAVLGTCHVVTALGLRPAAVLGRLLLATGGVATVLVSVFPVPRLGTSDIHRVVAGIGFATLTLWPVLACRRSRPLPWGLRPLVSITAAVVLLGLLVWFVAELSADGTRIGLTERLVAGSQALWPLVVVLSARWAGRSAWTATRRAPAEPTLRPDVVGPG
jgi:hypothetical membrane protein